MFACAKFPQLPGVDGWFVLIVPFMICIIPRPKKYWLACNKAWLRCKLNIIWLVSEIVQNAVLHLSQKAGISSFVLY